MGRKRFEERAQDASDAIKNGDAGAAAGKGDGGRMMRLVVVSVFVMLFFACAVFFVYVRGAEEVLVPEVRGKALADALIEMQDKELYPKITQRYSDSPEDAGTVLDQNPAAGSIVKGFSRVSLVVSRGVIVDHIESYVGMNIDDLKLRLQSLFAGSSRPLITLAAPLYKTDSSPAGTVIAQNPPENTEITEPVTMQLVVSKGPNVETVTVPDLAGMSVSDVLRTVAQTRLVFDFSAQPAANGAVGVVLSQQPQNPAALPNYSRVSVVIAVPEEPDDARAVGIFSAAVTDFPYPVSMRFDAEQEDGTVRALAKFMHPGGAITLPYSVPKNTTLILSVMDREIKRLTVY